MLFWLAILSAAFLFAFVTVLTLADGLGTPMSDKLRADGSDVEPYEYYAIEGTTLQRLMRIMSEMSSGVVMSTDRRRDLAQSVQDRLTEAILIDSQTLTQLFDIIEDKAHTELQRQWVEGTDQKGPLDV